MPMREAGASPLPHPLPPLLLRDLLSRLLGIGLERNHAPPLPPPSIHCPMSVHHTPVDCTVEKTEAGRAATLRRSTDRSPGVMGAI